MIENPCVVDHCCSNVEFFRMIDIEKNLTLNSPLSAIFRAVKNCLIAQARTYSGASNAQTNNGRRCSANDDSGFHIHLSIQLFAFLFFGHGMFGCTATQVHENIVTRQLHTMLQIVRQWVRSVQRFAANERSSMEGTGLASIKALRNK